MRLHEEAHSDDFQDHLNAKNQQEYNVQCFNDRIWLLQTRVFNGQANAVSENGQQDKLVKPRVEDYAHDCTSKSAGRCAAAQSYICKVPCLVLLNHLRDFLLLDDRLGELLVVASHLFYSKEIRICK